MNFDILIRKLTVESEIKISDMSQQICYLHYEQLHGRQPMQKGKQEREKKEIKTQ
jgi:hypothetical protein